VGRNDTYFRYHIKQQIWLNSSLHPQGVFVSGTLEEKLHGDAYEASLTLTLALLSVSKLGLPSA
ncbi:MAG: hypothetical protein WBE68_24630, partial [Candidatus Nitrosopolaris sp.]